MEDLQPEISVIIPVYHSGKPVADTCESLLSQAGVRWEAIFIDAGVGLQQSEMVTSEIINSYQDRRMRVQALTKGSLFALMNRGLLMGQGKYANLLLEGCTYLAPNSLAMAYKSILEKNNPDIFYTASYVGDKKGSENLYYIDDWPSALKKGFQPALLQSCFFKMSIFKKIDYFDQVLDRRGALDFFCRASTYSDIIIASEMRVYVELNQIPKELLTSWSIFRETWNVLYKHFGAAYALKWLISGQPLALLGGGDSLNLVIPERSK